MRHLKFPTYEYIKSLPRHRVGDEDAVLEYAWRLFELPIDADGTLSYNEDGDGYIRFDVFEGGFSGMNRLDLALKFNKTNYGKICKHAQEVFESFYHALDTDWSASWEKYGENNNENN